MPTSALRETTVQDYARRYPGVPHEVILKEDLLRLGLLGSLPLLLLLPPDRPPRGLEAFCLGLR